MTETVTASGSGTWPRRVVVLAAGSSTMAIQMCATRLLSPWVGGSSYMWATVIGLSLLAMSCGYALGGRMADRRPDDRLLGRILLQAALAVGVIPLLASLVLPRATLGLDGVVSSVLIGSAVGYLLLFAAPAVLLGMVPPFVIRLSLVETAQAGRTVGGIYALSTVGSIVGTIGSVLVLIQWIGTQATLWTIVAVLLAASVVAIRAGGGSASVEFRPPEASPSRSSNADVGRGAILPMRVATSIVVVEGIATMAGEMGAARLIAPFYGASTIVWANLIALVMLSIALGSWLGGRLADRRPTLGALAMLVTAGGVATAMLPFVAGPIMRLSTGGIDAVDVGTVVGSFFASVALLIVPMTLLGMVPPFVIRLAVPDVEHSGGAAGRLYAASTVGALVGTFASVLLLIPSIGTWRTLLLVGASLVVLAFWLALRTRGGERSEAGGASGRRVDPVVAKARDHDVSGSAPARRFPIVLVPTAAAALLVVLALVPHGYVKPIDGGTVVFEGESRYQFVQVVEHENGRRVLQLNEGWAVHSIYDPRTVLTGGIWDHFLVLPAMLERKAPSWDRPGSSAAGRAEFDDESDSTFEGDFLIIGNAAGTAARAYAALRPSMEVHGVELDPLVTAVGNDYFHMRDADPTITTADGRPFLAGTSRTWDVIHIDAYRQPYIPFYLTTREFFSTVADRLRPGGVVSINVGSTPQDDTINEHVAATMRDVFPLVARYRAEEYNEVIIGVMDPDVTLEELRERIRASDLARGDSPLFEDGLALERRVLGPLFDDFAEGLEETRPDDDLVLTDDHAPVEWMTDRMILGAAG